MVDMSIHDVSGVVGWCLGAYSEVENTYVHHLHTFLHTGSGLYNPLQHPRIVSRPHILYNISTTLYNTLQSTALQQFYSLQPLHHPSGRPSGEAASAGSAIKPVRALYERIGALLETSTLLTGLLPPM